MSRKFVIIDVPDCPGSYLTRVPNFNTLTMNISHEDPQFAL